MTKKKIKKDQGSSLFHKKKKQMSIFVTPLEARKELGLPSIKEFLKRIKSSILNQYLYLTIY